MTDHELLKLAAKASEIKYTVKNGVLVCHGDHVSPPMPWNPLDDDGDALRLAVSLHILVVRELGKVLVILPTDGAALEEIITDDPYAATRRAIVRAAAEMREGLK